MNRIYIDAERNGCTCECSCVGIEQYRWDELMNGAKRADRRKVIKAALSAGVIDEWTANRELKQPYFNPYKHFKTETHLIYVNSSIEYFLTPNT